MSELARSHLWQLVLINLVWGFNIVAIKLSVDRFPPVFLSFLRFLIVGLVVWPWRRWLGIGLSFIGIVVLGFNPEVFASWQGLLLIVIAAFIGAVGPVAIKRVHELEPLELQAWMALASLFAHTAYFALIRRYPVSSVAPITVLAPLFSVLFSVWLLSDVLDWRLIIGGLLTLSGVAVIVAREGKAAAVRA